MITLITESISCMTEEDCRKYGVTVLPLENVIGGKKVTDYIGDNGIEDGSFTLPRRNMIITVLLTKL